MATYIDSHAHLTSPEVLPFLTQALQRASAAGVSHMLNICTDASSLHKGIALAKEKPFIRNAGATTPHDVEEEGDSAFPMFEEAAIRGDLCAIGETGLDYYYKNLPKDLQKRLLVRYLHLAQRVHLPVIFHCRDAFADLFSIVDTEYKGPAILHCFTGTAEEASMVLERGWYLSLSGIVTFKKSEALRDIAKMTPLAQLLIETDTPYLAPQSHRGKQNEPAYLPETAQCIAAVKEISVAEVANATSENARKLFGFFSC